MGRNIVICFDVVEDLGWSERRTSVLKLYYAMTRDETQRTYISGPNSTRTYDGADSVLDVLKLHERFGFKKIGTFTEVGRKFGKYWDVIWMEKPFSESHNRASVSG